MERDKQTMILCACRTDPPGSTNTPTPHVVGEGNCSREIVPETELPDNFNEIPAGMFCMDKTNRNDRLYFKHPSGVASRLK